MAAKAGGDEEAISEINVVPLVDIVLVVLIIFMVTAPAMMKPSMPVQLPSAASGDESEPSLLQVAIDSEGQVFVNNVPVEESEARRLSAEQVERNPEVQAVIAADREVPHGTVIRVLDWVKSAGVRKFAVTTDKAMED